MGSVLTEQRRIYLLAAFSPLPEPWLFPLSVLSGEKCSLNPSCDPPEKLEFTDSSVERFDKIRISDTLQSPISKS